MKKLQELINKLNDIRLLRDDLKAKLNKYEIEKYYEWKKQNPTSRAAMEKVIAELKAQDKEWQELEVEYINTLNKYAYLRDIYNIVEGLSRNENYNKEDIEKFLEPFVI